MDKIQKLLNYCIKNIRSNDVIRKYHELHNSTHFLKEVNDKRQLKKLNKLLNHAYKNVPYYQRIFKECDIVKNEKIIIKNLLEFEKIPFLNKNIIRNEKNNLYSNDISKRKSYKNTSGGSTGEPVVIIQDRNYSANNSANFYISQSWRGADLYDSTFKIWGAERDIIEGKKPFKESINNFLCNRLLFNSFKMSEEDMLDCINALNKHKPKIIITYVQSIYEIAKFAKQNNIYVAKQNAVHTAAGTLYKYIRKEIEEVFQCEVFNHYGSREVGAIASECNIHNGLHIMMDHTLVEVINKDGHTYEAGEKGEIVVTTLNNFSMPLIRYQINDIGIMQEYNPCECGCSYPKLEKVIGRTTDIFKTKTGHMVDGEYFTHLFYFQEWIKAFQVIQLKIDLIKVKIVKIDIEKKNRLNDLESKIKLVMGKNCKVIFEYVDDIPKTKTGKFLYTISKVK